MISVLLKALIILSFMISLEAILLGPIFGSKFFGLNVAHPSPGWAFPYVAGGSLLFTILIAMKVSPTQDE